MTPNVPDSWDRFAVETNTITRGKAIKRGICSGKPSSANTLTLTTCRKEENIKFAYKNQSCKAVVS